MRSGGDAGAQARLQGPPPTEKLVAFFTGPVQVGADGRAQLHFDPKVDNCDPVVISLGREQALAVAHALAGRLAEWGDDSAAGAFDAAV